jgi:hypothetical protein
MSLSPRLPHFVWSANPLTGGNTSGPAKPVPRCSPTGVRPFVRGASRKAQWSSYAK